MIKAGETFTVLIVYVCVTILSACTGNVDSVPVPVDVIFDSQRERNSLAVSVWPLSRVKWSCGRITLSR
jgi:hypothetical protein